MCRLRAAFIRADLGLQGPPQQHVSGGDARPEGVGPAELLPSPSRRFGQLDEAAHRYLQVAREGEEALRARGYPTLPYDFAEALLNSFVRVMAHWLRTHPYEVPRGMRVSSAVCCAGGARRRCWYV